VVWPESAFPFYLSENPEALARIARMLPVGTSLVTGAPWLDPEDRTGSTAFNAMLAINFEGEITSSYAKTHLVPFGEYLPFAGIWEQFGLKQFVPGSDGWTSGSARRLMSANNGLKFLPLVCYEAIFSGDLFSSNQSETEDADYILNVTNDGWFDGSIGGAQHFNHALLRAVEEGKTLIRVANTGITAAVDPLGRVYANITPGEVGLVDIIPARALEATFFSKWRHWPLFFVLASVLMGAFFGFKKAKNPQ
jgi:apolipoprotein N-acyltransferase